MLCFSSGLVVPTVGSVKRAVVGDARHFRNAAAFRAYTGLVPRESFSCESEKRRAITKTGPNLLRMGALPRR